MSDLDLQLWGTPSRASNASRKLRRQGAPSAMDRLYLGVVEAGRVTGTVLDGLRTVMPAAPGKLAFGVELRVGHEPMKRFAVVDGLPGMLRQAPKPERGDATLRWNATPAEMGQMLAMAEACLDAEVSANMPGGADPGQRRAFARDLVLNLLDSNAHVQGGVQAANAVACMATWLIRTSSEAQLVQWTPETVGSAALIIWQTGHDAWNFRIEVTPAGAVPEIDRKVDPAKPAVPEVLAGNRRAILKLAAAGVADSDWRMTFYHQLMDSIVTAREGLDLSGDTRRGGWMRVGNDWYAMEDQLPVRQPGLPIRVSSFRLQVVSIMFSIVWTLTADDVTVSGIHDEIDDDLLDWVRFTRLLVNGGYPHASMSMTNSTFMAVEPAGGDTCRFSFGDIDVLLPRQMLLDAFRDFLSAIADHPCFALWYLCTEKLDAPEVEALHDEADAAVAAGILDPLDPVGLEHGYTVDAKDEFSARYMAERVSFSDKEAAWIERWRTTLKTLEIPKDWQQ